MFCRIYTDCAIKCFIRTHNRVTCALDNDCLNRFHLVKIDKAQALKLPLKKARDSPVKRWYTCVWNLTGISIESLSLSLLLLRSSDLWTPRCRYALSVRVIVR